jgi:hypothetical protein
MMGGHPSPRSLRRSIARHAKRLLPLMAVGVVLTWLVMSKSFSFVIAQTSPNFALWLNPYQPVALGALADRAREKLVKLTPFETDITASIDKTGPKFAERGPDAMPDDQSRAPAREVLRREIHTLANRILANQPLDATAFRLLAEATTEPEGLRPLMQHALERSRREANAAIWLMNDSYEQNNLPGVVENADILLRTHPRLHSHAMRYLADVAGTVEGRALLVRTLALNPPWRAAFMTALPRYSRAGAEPLDLLIGLREAGSTPMTNELAAYLDHLIGRKQTELAYVTWLQFVPPQKLSSVGLLNNAALADTPSGLPFDWKFQRGQNATAELVPLRTDPGRRAVHFNLGPGRVRFPEMSQILLLPSGLFRFEGAFQGKVTGKRGLRWEVHCLDDKILIGEIAMGHGNAKNWESFMLDVRVPEGDGCRAQALRLRHDSRSPSEEIISGELSLAEFKLSRLPTGGTQPP